MWSFYILCLQAMIVIAWNGSGELSAIFQGDVFLKVLSIFITAAVLKLAQALLDIALSWKARHSMSPYVKLRYVLKAGAAAGWVIVMPVAYGKNASGFALTIKNWFGGHSHNSPSLFHSGDSYLLIPEHAFCVAVFVSIHSPLSRKI